LVLAGSNGTLTADAGNSAYSYSWSSDNSAFVITLASKNSSTVVFSAPSTIGASANLTVTVTDPTTLCSSTCSQQVSTAPPSMITDTMRCALPGNNFRLIFTQDTQYMPCYKLNASNPGQFYFNVFYTQSSQPQTFTIQIPYPWVTQGANPIEVYNAVTVGSCLSGLGTKVYAGSQSVMLKDYPKQQFGQYVTLSIPVPAGSVYLAIHLDYGLKGYTGYGTDANGNATVCNSTATPAPVPFSNGQPYTFTVNGAGPTIYGANTFNGGNDFKKTTGTAGIALKSTTKNPVAGANAVLKDSTNKVLGSGTTDSDGWYMINYKWTGKAATFNVTLTPPNGTPQTQTITLKSNGYIEADFTVP
jgi:hypothetical protein